MIDQGLGDQLFLPRRGNKYAAAMKLDAELLVTWAIDGGGGEMERWKWEGSKMDVCSKKFADFLEDSENNLVPNFSYPWDVSSLFPPLQSCKCLLKGTLLKCMARTSMNSQFFSCYYSILISNLYMHHLNCGIVEFSNWPLWPGAWEDSSNRTSHPQLPLP